MTLLEEMAELRKTALRVKAERDRAVALLEESLSYSFLGAKGDFKTRVMAFLLSIRERV